MLDKKEKILNREGDGFLITHNLRGDEIEGWVNQFKRNETFRQHKHKHKNYLTHEILSWHKDDVKNITLDKMEDMARQYIQLRNPNGMYVAIPHFDKEHWHIHFCISALEYKTGKAMRMSKKEYQELKKNIQQYQIEKFPELSNSIVNHGRRTGKSKNISDKEYQLKLRTGRETLKEELAGKINQCLAKANSMNSFLQILKENNLIPYQRGGRFSGVVFQGRKFRFNRLQINITKIQELNKTVERERQIQITRWERKNKSRGLSK